MLSHLKLSEICLLFTDPSKQRSKGICYGLSAVYLDALFSNNIQHIFKILALLEKYQDDNKKLMNDIEDVHKKITARKGVALTPTENLLLEVRPFCESILLQLHPYLYTDIYNKKVMQNYISNRLLTSPKSMDGKRVYQFHRSYHAYQEKELLIYFKLLERLFSSTEQTIGLLIESDEHAIVVSYDSSKRHWRILNADTLHTDQQGEYHQKLNSKQLSALLHKALVSVFDEIEDNEQEELIENTCSVFQVSYLGIENNLSLQRRLEQLFPLKFTEEKLDCANQDDVTIFMLAALGGDLQALKVMLPKVFNLDEERYDGENALTLAVQEGHLKVVDFLVTNGADVFHRNNQHQGLLHIASAMGHLKIIKYLILLGLDINACDADGNPPINHAILNGQTNAVGMLLSAGANVNYNNQGITPLFHACYINCLTSVVMLINAGANIKYKSIDGLTANEIALSQGHYNISFILQSMTRSLQCYINLLPYQDPAKRYYYLTYLIATKLIDKLDEVNQHSVIGSMTKKELCFFKKNSDSIQREHDRRYGLVPYTVQYAISAF